MKNFIIKIFHHKVYSLKGKLLEEWYEGELYSNKKDHFDYGLMLAEAKQETEEWVVNELTNWIKSQYCIGEKFKIKVLK
jgi:hypothetical protein